MPATVVNDAGPGYVSPGGSGSGVGTGSTAPVGGGSDPYNSTPYTTPIPGVSDYMGADAQAIKAYNDALANINQSRQTLLRANGYTGTVDPQTGNITNLQIDPYNPYGQLQQMFGSQAHEDIAADEGNVERGLHGGLAHQAEQALKYSHGLERTNFGQIMQGNLQSLTSQQTDAASARDNALWQAQLAAEINAAMNQQFDPALYDNGGQQSNNDQSVPFASLGNEIIGRNQHTLKLALQHVKFKKKGGR